MGCWDLCLWEGVSGILGIVFCILCLSCVQKILKINENAGRNNQDFWCSEHGHGTQKPYKSWRSKLDFQLVIVIKCRLFDLYFRRINTFQYNKENKVQLFQIPSNQLKIQLENAKCLECNQMDSNACRNMLFVNSKSKQCSYNCQRIPETIGIFTNEEIELRLNAQNVEFHKEESKEWIWTENLEIRKKRPTVSVKVICKEPKHFFNQKVLTDCEQEYSGVGSKCKEMQLKCIGNDEWKWVQDDPCRACQEDQECRNINKGNICHGKVCYKEVLLVNLENQSNSTKIVFYDPIYDAIDSCQISKIPLMLKNPLVSFFKGVLQICDDNGKCFEFDNKVWKEIAGWTKGRKRASGVTLNDGQWWVTGGRSEKGPLLKTTQVLPSKQTQSGWKRGTELPQPQEGHCMVELNNGKVLVAGGAAKIGLTRRLKSSWLYDPDSEEFLPVGNLNFERNLPSCAPFEENVYLVGKGEIDIETEIFDQTLSTWNMGPTLPEQALDDGSLAVIQNKLFYSDGLNIYTLQKDKWTHVAGIGNYKASQSQFHLIVAIFDIYSNDESACNFAKIKVIKEV